MNFSMKMLAIPAILIIGGLTTGCTKIPPGYVGIKVNNVGSNKGVQSYPALTGLQFYNPFTESFFEYPVFVQTAKWTASKDEGRAVNEEVSFSSKDSMVVYGDISLSYQLDPAKVPQFYVQFRNDDLDKFTHGFLRNIARDAFGVSSDYTVDELYSTKRQEFLERVKAKINAQVNPYGVIIDQFGFLGALRLPPTLVETINAKIKATQDAIRVENEKRITEAEAAKVVAQAKGEAEAKIEAARGDAEANRLRQQSLTPIILEAKRLEIQRAMTDKWNGVLPTNLYGSAPVPFINVK